jgi:hypothetical protein
MVCRPGFVTNAGEEKIRLPLTPVAAQTDPFRSMNPSLVNMNLNLTNVGIFLSEK